MGRRPTDVSAWPERRCVACCRVLVRKRRPRPCLRVVDGTPCLVVVQELEAPSMFRRRQFCDDRCKGRVIGGRPKVYGSGKCERCDSPFRKQASNQRFCSERCENSCGLARRRSQDVERHRAYARQWLKEHPERYQARYKKARLKIALQTLTGHEREIRHALFNWRAFQRSGIPEWREL